MKLSIFLSALLAMATMQVGPTGASQPPRDLAMADSVYIHHFGISDPDTRDERLTKMLLYESQKKEPALGLALGLLIPGLGNFYAGDDVGGTGLMGFALIGIVLAVGGDETTSGLGAGMILLSVIVSPIGGAMASTRANRELREELKLAFLPSRKAPTLAVLYRF